MKWFNKDAHIVTLVVLLGLALSGCGPNIGELIGESSTIAPVSGTTAAVSSAPTDAPEESTASLAATPTVVSESEATAAMPVVGDEPQVFAIDQTARSDQSALERVELTLSRAVLSRDGLTLRVSFRNTSDEGFSIIGGISGNDALLIDAAGNEYEPTDISNNLRSSINPDNGFGPGAANVGDVTFPVPEGGEPYELQFPTYDPIEFRFDKPIDVAATLELAPGEYPIDQNLRSAEDALRKVELQVRSLQVTEDAVILNVAFTNTDRQGYDLILGPDGTDARLLDGEGSQYEPTEVSDSLETSIAPENGWLPGQANEGTLTFERPAALQELRFIFPNYDALTLRFDQSGIAEASVTSPTGGAPQPTPVPSASELAFAEIEQLLASQSNALLAGDAAMYLNSFAPEAQEEQRRILERVAQMPLVSYTLRLAPDAEIPDDAGDTLEDVAVEMSYGLRGISDDNPFDHEAVYSFTRAGGSWQISSIEFDENPPFWIGGDVQMRETPHFLIFVRPEAAGELATLEQEAEAAYAALQARNLPLEPKYVAYFTSTQDDFAELTGRASNRVLGIALSRYQFNGDEIAVSSRAFYINGEAFTNEARPIPPEERQTTITHELVHLALSRETRPFTPLWIVEGAAVYYSEDLGGDKRQLLLENNRLDNVALGALTTAGTLGEHDFLGEQTSVEYTFSGETFAYLVETFGEAKTLEFYRAYAQVPSADVRDKMPRFGSAFLADSVFADLRAELTEQYVQQSFGISLAQLDADVKTWLREG
jgi:hypothetical protein